MNSNPFITLFKHSFIYGIGRTFLSLTAFILMPIFTNPEYLSVSDYGIWQILNITMTILVTIMSMGMATTLFRFYYDEPDEYSQKRVSNTIFWLLIISSFLFFFLYVTLIQSCCLAWLHINSSILKYLKWIILGAALQVAVIVPLNILRAQERPWHYVVFQLLQFTLLMTSLLLFLLYFKWQLKGMVMGYIIAFGGNFLLLLFSYRQNLHFEFDIPLLKKMLKFGLPLIVLHLGGWILSVFDRYLIGFQLSYNDAAIYSVGYQFGAVVNIAVIMPFSVAWGPFMFKVFKQREAPAIYTKTLNYIAIASLYVAFLLSIFSKEILTLFTSSPEYLNAQPIIGIVAFGHVFYGMYYVFTTGLNVTNRTYFFPFIILATAIINIVTNYLLIPRFGIIAPAMITVISYGFLAFLTFYFSQKYYQIPFEFWKIFLLFIVFIAIAAFGYLWQSNQLYIHYSIKLLIIIFPVPFLYWSKIFGAEEIDFIKKKLQYFLKIKK